jgi:ElaB/YqjD/DUF883 family membrane-anchored ribosome-binding protein
MSSANSSSESTSDKTSTSAPKTPGSEADYLAQQAEEAKKAMQQALGDLLGAFGDGVDPRNWVQQRPWTTVGTAAVAGFFAAYGLVPSKDQAAIKRIEAIEEAVARGHMRAAKAEGPNGEPNKPQKPGAGAWLLRSIARQSFNLLKPTLMAAVAANVRQDRQERETEASRH